MLGINTNTTLENIAETLVSNDEFFICGHIHPDGDCVGSTLGLTWALRRLGKKATPLIASEAIDHTLQFLPLYGEVVSTSSVDLESMDGTPIFIGVDVPSNERLGKAGYAIKERCSLSITIDHHEYWICESDLCYAEPDSASTTIIIWKLCMLLGFDPVKDDVSPLATCMYTGLLTDTNRFTNQNADLRAFQAAAQFVAAGADASRTALELFQARTMASLRMDAKTVENAVVRTGCRGLTYAMSHLSDEEIKDAGASYEDLDGCIDILRSLDGIDVACILKEGDGIVRGSFRAKGDVDVAELARMLGGGGHKAAAGFTIDGSMDDAIVEVSSILDDGAPGSGAVVC